VRSASRFPWLGAALAWQLAFLLISKDVQRCYLFMIPGIAEKLPASVSTLLLYAANRIAALTAVPAIVDLALALSSSSRSLSVGK
jgi:hypothetical protein